MLSGGMAVRVSECERLKLHIVTPFQIHCILLAMSWNMLLLVTTTSRVHRLRIEKGPADLRTDEI